MIDRNAATRARLLAHLECDFDPADADVAVRVDDTWYAATWLAPAVQARDKLWWRTARTTAYFAGPAVATIDVSGATVLTAGDHPTATRVTLVGEIIVETSDTIRQRGPDDT